MGDHFSSAELRLKQVDATTLDDLARYALDAAFPDYGASPETAERATSELGKLFGVTPEFDASRARRFAGDSTLPRACYHSIADDDRGWDGRTLLREMSAYLLESPYPGLVSLFDNSMTNSVELLGILAATPRRNQRALDLSIPSFLVGLRPLSTDPTLRDAYGRGRHYLVQIPFRLWEGTVDGVIDLRRPAARQWLLDRFRDRIVVGKEEFPILLGRAPPADFGQLLPTLLDQWLGGGWTTANLTGIFARRAGASGLVYPSARSNSRVDLADGRLRDSAGWCFVRYPSDSQMLIDSAFSIAADDWPSTAGWAPSSGSWVDQFIPVRDSRIDYVTAGTAAGSWEVHGLAEYNIATYRLSQVGAVLRAMGEEPGEAARTMMGLALYSSAADIEFVANAVMYALLGDERSSAKLANLATAAGSDIERDALTRIVASLDHVPGNFRATGILAQAWGFS